ncbi:hypothetical protein [Novosphingobium guangzhouense]|uniref:Cupin 2 conserved barrel domain-containing protein n=1 Tax=Novosphingobium guangzhouense TaxID=1850347 RepID=A0A2K2G387_9SPHN|nr:hypothetical protein [Novosphingobium guangzhouense]PNU05494.1 hypothetical protein A8V01_16045 [Novosphingobium guangzhouense]
MIHPTSLKCLAAAALASLVLPAGSAHAEADSLLSWTDMSKIRIYHAYAASDGKSYVEEMDIPANVRMTGSGPTPTYFDFKDAHAVRIGRGKSGAIFDWHGATEFRHLLVPLQGNLFFDLGDGRTLSLKPGEALYAEDWTGRGHRSGCEESKQLPTCVALDILIDENPHAMPLRSPPSGK